MVKKIILSFLVFLLLTTYFLLPFSVSVAYAQTTNPWYEQSFNEWYVKVYDQQVSPPNEIFGERYTAAQVWWVIYGLIAFFFKSSSEDSSRLSCIISVGNVDQCLEQYPPPFISSTSPADNQSQSVLATLFSEKRDLSGVNYVREKITKLNFIPETKAQGFGFGALSPVRNIWRTFRDIAYALFVILIIILAFMIMFRYKINPQTVVSVQSAIPRVVITLIFVTFSYAIAGFMVDLVYVVIGLLALVFSSGGVFTGNWQTIFQLLTDGPTIQGFQTGILGLFTVAIPLYFAAVFGVVFGMTGFAAWGAAIGFLIAIIFVVLFAIWAIWAAIRILLLLLRTYITIVILVIFSPLHIAIGALEPGLGFGRWLRSLIANLAVYPMVGALFLVAIMFLASTYQQVANAASQGFGVAVTSPFNCPGQPTCPSWYPPLTFGTQTGNFDPLPALWVFASIGVLGLIPRAGDMIKNLIEKGTAGVGFGIGEALAPAAFIGGIAAGRIERGYAAGAEQAELEYKRLARPTPAAEENILRTQARLKRLQDLRRNLRI